MKKYIIILGLLLLSIFTHSKSEIRNIIFDLGYTTFEPKKLKCGMELGIIDSLGYLKNHSKEYLQDSVFEVLSFLGEQEGEAYELVRTNTGAPAPTITVEWFKGNITSQDIFEQLTDLLQELCNEDYFENEREYRLIKNTFNIMFDPQTLAKVMKPIDNMQRLIKKLAQIRDEDGNPQYQFFILSNWDRESFDVLYEKYPKFFARFDPEHIIISGEIGLVKPHPAIFEYMLTTYNLDSAQCLFIDDQLENIEAAERCDINAMQYDYKHHKEFEKELKLQEIL
ncbi:MAG: HAD-IA family hydrolase [Candidatus Babeliaceae bacterium]